MKKLVLAVASLQFLVLAAFAADSPRECSLCTGVVGQTEAAVPSLLFVDDSLAPARGGPRTSVIVRYSASTVGEVETKTKAILDWATANGPFEAIGVDASTPSIDITAYAIKRLAVTAQGQNVASKILLRAASTDDLNKLADAGAMTYVDAFVADASAVESVAAWIAERDPAKKIYAVVTPQSPNAFFDAAQTFAKGATRAYLIAIDDPASLASLNRAFIGDYAYDATAQTTVLDAKGNKTSMPVLTFIRGEDLRTIVIPRGDSAAPTIASLPGDRYANPRKYDSGGEKEIADVGVKGGRYLIGIAPVKRPFVLTADHTEKPEVTKEAISVQTERGITVEEIIRNHQAYKSYQESVQPRYIARDATKLRFTIEGGEAIEATIAGDYFSEPQGRADWIWQDFFLNGVKWKYGKIPELPLIQPEKVTQLPLDIHLTNEYRYQLVRATDVNGYHVYEVRFEPPPNAPAALPLYRGTVWIDTHTWARVRLAMTQLHLSGEVLSNEERVDFQPFARATHAPMTAADVAKSDAREIIWLAGEVGAQQVISAAGRASVILRSTTFSDFRLDPADFEERLRIASASDYRIVRETDAGLRYLEKTPTGERVVKEGFDTSRTFALGGIHHDAGLEFPVLPLGGVDYFNFDWKKTGIQANVFFAGIVIAANATNPDFANTRTNLGADLFAIAIPTTETMFRFGKEVPGEAVKSLPTNLTFRAGHPFLGFGKVDFSFGVSHTAYRRADDTAADYVVPSSTFELTPSLEAQYSRWGYTIGGFYDYTTRTNWKPWGIPSEFNPNQKTYTTFGGEISKSFYLPKFQRISVELNYLDGQRLDRFSKWQFGFFGSRRIHGVQSGSVTAEQALLAHFSYGFVFSEQFRMEAFYDHGLLDDAIEGFHHEPFQGVGVAGQTIGPKGTLVRLDIGKTVGRNAQRGFVANVVFLKLF
jgi:hypothetical protein